MVTIPGGTDGLGYLRNLFEVAHGKFGEYVPGVPNVVQLNPRYYPQPCPTARPEVLKKYTSKVEKILREQAEKGNLYCGTFGLDKGAKKKLKKTELKQLLDFHGLQRVLQVLLMLDPMTPEHRQGLTNTNRIDAIEIRGYDSSIKKGWLAAQRNLEERYYEMFGNDIALIKEYFEIVVEPILTEKEEMYDIPPNEHVCCHEWYAVTLKLKKDIPPEHEQWYKRFAAHWEAIRSKVTKEGGKMGPAPKPRKDDPKPKGGGEGDGNHIVVPQQEVEVPVEVPEEEVEIEIPLAEEEVWLS